MRGHRLTDCPQNNTDVEPDLANEQAGIVKERTFESHFALTTRSRPKAKVAKKDKPDQPSDKMKNTASRKKLGRTADSRPKKDTAKTAKPGPERQVKPTKTPDGYPVTCAIPNRSLLATFNVR